MGVRRGGGFVCDLAAAHAFSGRPGNGWGIAQHVWSPASLVSSPSSPKSRLGMQDNLKIEQKAALKWETSISMPRPHHSSVRVFESSEIYREVA